MGLFSSPDEPFSDLLQRLKAERAMPREAGDLFHQLRIAGSNFDFLNIYDAQLVRLGALAERYFKA